MKLANLILAKGRDTSFARVGELTFFGTADECLAWMVEQQAKCLQMATAIHDALTDETTVELPCHGERRST